MTVKPNLVHAQDATKTHTENQGSAEETMTKERGLFLGLWVLRIIANKRQQPSLRTCAILPS